MAHNDDIVPFTLAAQERVFRLAQRDHGLSLKAIGLDAGIPYNSLRTYASGQAQMPFAVFVKLMGVIPDDLLSLMTEIGGRCVTENLENVDVDAVADKAVEFLDRKNRAHHPASPGGAEITDCERADLNRKATKIIGAVS